MVMPAPCVLSGEREAPQVGMVHVYSFPCQPASSRLPVGGKCAWDVRTNPTPTREKALCNIKACALRASRHIGRNGC